MTSNWLDPLRQALDWSITPTSVFFRDDDAGWDDAGLDALLDIFDRHGMPVDVAVIPAALSPPLAARLRRRIRGGCVRLHQHGYSHENHERDGRKHEFGPSRDAASQSADITRGRLVLQDCFDGAVQPVFTPPWNRCTSDTANVLVAQGFEVLARDHTAPRLDRCDLTEVPVTVDWFGHHKGLRWTQPQLGHRLAQGVASGDPVGVMLHHARSDAGERAAIEQLVELIRDHPQARSTSIIELARRSSSCDPAESAGSVSGGIPTRAEAD